MTAPSVPSWLAGARETIAKATNRDAPGFPSPLPWYVSGERPMVWADDGDATVSIGASDETPYIEPPVAALIVLAVNALPALLAVVEAAANMRKAVAGCYVQGQTATESTHFAETRDALDAALLALASVPRG